MALGKPSSGWMDTNNGREQQLEREHPEFALQRAHSRVHVRHAQRPGGRHRSDGPRSLPEHPRAPGTDLRERAAGPEEMETRGLVVRREEYAAGAPRGSTRTSRSNQFREWIILPERERAINEGKSMRCSRDAHILD